VVLGGLFFKAPIMQASYSLPEEVPTLEPELAMFLPIITSPPLLVADFSSCDSTNHLGGEMGAAYVLPDNQVIETYEKDSGGVPPWDCYVHVKYQIKDWGAFWLKLEHADIENLHKLIFDIKGDETAGIPEKVKIEIKRDCHQVDNGVVCNEIVNTQFEDISEVWQRNSEIDQSAFNLVDGSDPTEDFDWSDIEELVFTFEVNSAGQEGGIFLDNIRFEN
jgi:hypothetical protein